MMEVWSSTSYWWVVYSKHIAHSWKTFEEFCMWIKCAFAVRVEESFPVCETWNAKLSSSLCYSLLVYSFFFSGLAFAIRTRIPFDVVVKYCVKSAQRESWKWCVCRFLSTSNVGRAHDDDAILSLSQSIVCSLISFISSFHSVQYPKGKMRWDTYYTNIVQLQYYVLKWLSNA
jgi:hypothetical protein